MNVSDKLVENLTQSLSQYNPVTNDIMIKIAKVMQPIGLAIIGILFLVEWADQSKKFDREDGAFTIEFVLNIGMKYFIATIGVMMSGVLIDAIFWIGIQAIKWINSMITLAGENEAIPQMAKVAWWQKGLVFLFQIGAYFFMWLSKIVTNILLFLRAIELYIVKALAPILIAFMVHEDLKSIAMNWFKYVMALVLQGVILILTLGLIVILMANDYSSFNELGGGVWSTGGAVFKNIGIYFTLILKYGVIIYLLIGSQGKAKRFMGAM